MHNTLFESETELMHVGSLCIVTKGIPVSRVLCHSLTEVTEIPGKGMGIL